MNDDGLNKVNVVPVSEPPPMEGQAQPLDKSPTSTLPIETVDKKGSGSMPKPKQKMSVIPVVLILIVVAAGIASGYSLTVMLPKGSSPSTSSGSTTAPQSAEAVEVGKTYGAKEGVTFPDKAEGVLVKGGIDGEGSHHLMRDGGPARNVYLTSSVLDMDLFLNHLIEVDGETFKGLKAGWLMDVGLVKVVKLNADKPFAEATPETVMAE